MTDNELLLAISDMLDNKLKSELQPLKNELQNVKDDVHQIKLYQDMQKVLAEHSEKLQKLA